MSAADNERFDAALAAFKRLRVIELAIPGYNTMEQEQANRAADEAKLNETMAAFQVMVEIPAADGIRAAQKLSSIAEFYDLGAGGMNREILAQVIAEIGGLLAPAAKASQCQQCRFWDRYVDGGDGALNARIGDCRHGPPAISDKILECLMPGFGCTQTDDIELNVYAASAFPVTHEESWCGRFEHQSERTK